MKLYDLILLSIDADESTEYDVDLLIKVNGQLWHAHTACVAHRDILLLCDKGTATFLVDSYGDKNTVDLFDWNENEDE